MAAGWLAAGHATGSLLAGRDDVVGSITSEPVSWPAWCWPGPVRGMREAMMTSAVERVVADDVEGHDVGPFLVADDPGFAGVAGRGDLGLVGVEVIGADPGAAQIQARSPTLVGRIHRSAGAARRGCACRVS